MGLEKAVHLVSGLDANQPAGLRDRQLPRADTFERDCLERRARQTIRIGCEPSCQFLRDFQVQVHDRPRSHYRLQQAGWKGGLTTIRNSRISAIVARTPGTQIGPYSITALIGTGGMGDVYRAHDPRLGRDVAIKVGAEAFSERFTREARAIAALNHTNICHLYDVGPNYLVMECVEGESPRGPLAFEEALPILRQLVDGIEAAHEKDIVHRDLKPANIKISFRGGV
jgi:serine/threonine protein kinase